VTGFEFTFRRRRTRCLLLAGLLFAAWPSALLAEQQVSPVLRQVDTTYPGLTGSTHRVAAGENLQAVLDQAQPGDTIELEAGAIFTGPFVLPRKPLPPDGKPRWILIRSAAPAGALPPEGTRVDPSHAEFMATLEATKSPILSAAPGAHHYRLEGIRIRPAGSGGSVITKLAQGARRASTGADPFPPGTTRVPFLYNLVSLGTGMDRLDDLPQHIIFDRCYVHGDPVVGARRGFALNSRDAAIINSYLSDFKEVGADAQAILGWSGPGPYRIANNTLEAAGENILFGGVATHIEGMIPADIEIVGNHFRKPLSWKHDDPSFEGTVWTVKNLFELKSAERVLIEGNLLEYNWPQAQNGFAVLFTVRNARGDTPWATIRDVTFRNNVVREVASGINILGLDTNGHPSRRAERIVIDNNAFLSVGGTWGRGILFQLLKSTDGIVISNNTANQTGNIILAAGDASHESFRFVNNVMPHNRYGIIGSGVGSGRPTLQRDFPDAEVTGNVLIGGKANLYPRGNEFPATQDIFDASRGVDWTELCAALAIASPSPVKELDFCAEQEL
jgi:hypothetical protein